MLQDSNYICMQSSGTLGIHNELGDAHILSKCSDEVSMFLPCCSGYVEVGEVGITFEGLHKALLHCLSSYLIMRQIKLLGSRSGKVKHRKEKVMCAFHNSTTYIVICKHPLLNSYHKRSICAENIMNMQESK